MNQTNARLAQTERFGNVEVVILADPSQEIANSKTSSSSDGLKTTSGFSDILPEVKLRELVKSIASSFGEDMASVQKSLGSAEIELELSLSLSGKAWMVVKAEGHVTLKMTWKKETATV